MAANVLRHRTMFFVAIALVLGALYAPLHFAMAQDAGTPVPPETIPGQECNTKARAYTFVDGLLLTPDSGLPYVAPTKIPEGVPVDAKTEQELRATIRQFIACSNSGDVLRALGMLSDDYLRRLFDPSGKLDPETANKLLETLATPTVIATDELVTFIGIREMVQLPDGTVAVVLETDGGVPNPEGTDVDLFIFERTDNGWLVVDALNDIDQVEVTNATPEAES